MFLLVFIAACGKEDAQPDIPTQTITIVLDLEEESYRLNGQWYAWHTPRINCEPHFSTYLDWEHHSLHLLSCANTGQLLVDSITLRHNTCSGLAVIDLAVSENRADHDYQILLDASAVDCLSSSGAWLTIQFSWVP